MKTVTGTSKTVNLILLEKISLRARSMALKDGISLAVVNSRR